MKENKKIHVGLRTNTIQREKVGRKKNTSKKRKFSKKNFSIRLRRKFKGSIKLVKNWYQRENN